MDLNFCGWTAAIALFLLGCAPLEPSGKRPSTDQPSAIESSQRADQNNGLDKPTSPSAKEQKADQTEVVLQVNDTSSSKGETTYTDIASILSSCGECHESEISDNVLEFDGEPADWQNILRVMRSDDPDVMMPPEGKLPEKALAKLDKFVADGALMQAPSSTDVWQMFGDVKVTFGCANGTSKTITISKTAGTLDYRGALESCERPTVGVSIDYTP